MSRPLDDPRAFLEDLFRAAIASADPLNCVPPFLPPAPAGRTLVIGAGKASARMAQAVEQAWAADGRRGALSGLVVTRYGHGAPCKNIEIVEAAHPVPDAAGEAAARRILKLVRGLTRDDLVLCLISGGGSALLAAPADGLTLADKQDINRQLLRAGASISEMNAVRKHLSAIKGGRLAAAAAPARVVTLAISDVPGDDPSVIASGPTVADPSTYGEARTIVARYGLDLPPAASRILREAGDETPKPGDPRLAGHAYHMIASPAAALAAAAALAEKAGVGVENLGDAIEGHARTVGQDHAALALRRQAALAAGQSLVLLSGGETTVVVRGTGKGGRNAEYALAQAVALNGAAGIAGLAGDTDGIDGITDAAGVVFDPATLERARRGGLDPAARLDDNDAYSLFSATGGLIVTGPTLTNVNDFRATLICHPSDPQAS